MLLAVVLSIASTGSVSTTDVLAQVRAGKLLCVNPDEKSKTCSTIDTFVISENGKVIDGSELLISADRQMTVEVSSVVHVEYATICGSIELTDLQGGQVRLDGRLLPPDRNAAVLSVFVERLRPLAGRSVCEVLRLEDGQLKKFGQVDRVDIGLPGKPLRWISPEEGFRVAPRS